VARLLAPTSVPGALEQALVGLPVAECESALLAVQHVVRSFEPCMVCAPCINLKAYAVHSSVRHRYGVQLLWV